METVAKSLRWNVKLTRSSRYIRSLVGLNGAQGHCNLFLNVFIRIGHSVPIKYIDKVLMGLKLFVGLSCSLDCPAPVKDGGAYRKPNLLR